jgi:ABC-2 type transport system permease protein
VMIPGLLGLVVMFMTTMMTAMGIVREQEYGTMEQLMVTPLRPFELILGKLLPYFLIAAIDFTLVFVAGVYLFDLSFAGNLPVFLALSLLLVFTTLGLGLLISTVAQNQQQAMQLAIFTIIPQILMSGLIFPLSSLPRPIQAIAYLLPFTHYVPIARGMFIKGQGLDHLTTPALVLAAYAVVVVAAVSLRFRKRLG